MESFKFKASKSCDAQSTPIELTAGMTSNPHTTHVYHGKFSCLVFFFKQRQVLTKSATSNKKVAAMTANKLHVVKNAPEPSAGTGKVDAGSHSPPATMPVQVDMNHTLVGVKSCVVVLLTLPSFTINKLG